MSKCTLLVFLFTVFQSYSQNNTNVCFGEHADSMATKELKLLRVFLDKNGDFYPENIISEAELESNNTELVLWARNNSSAFKKIANDHNIECDGFTEIAYLALQDSIIAKHVLHINQSSINRPVTFLIHGFRKKAYGQIYNADTGEYKGPETYSIEDNEIGRNKMQKDQFFVEIYWNGHYARSFSSLKRYLYLAEIFRTKAVPNAERVGYSLRKLIQPLSSKKLNFISHSTGTHVLTSLLYNKNSRSTLPTPTQEKVNIVLLASASSGKKHFQNYYSRNTTLDFKSKDNYSLFIVFNEADPVLKKKGFSRAKGNTTLGCNHQGELRRLKKYFKKRFPNSPISAEKTSKTKNHTFEFYVNDEAFTKIVNKL